MDERDIAQRTAEWFLPGAGGRAVEAALRSLASHPGECRLTIEKRRNESGRFVLTVSATADSSSPDSGQTTGAHHADIRR